MRPVFIPMHGFQAIGPSTTLEYATNAGLTGSTGVFAETPRFPKNTQEGNLHESLHNPHGTYYIRSSHYDILFAVYLRGLNLEA